MKNNEVVKVVDKTPQSLIHIRHTITERQYKYWYLFLKLCKEKTEQGEEKDNHGLYFLTLSDLGDFLGYEISKKELKADLEKLRQEPIILNYLEKDGKPVTHGMGFISEWKITPTKVGFRLPPFIENALLENEATKQMFLLMDWEIFNSFNGKYEAIIYKLCKDYIGVGRTPFFTVQEYRNYIGLMENEYPQFFRLNEWTISKPVKAINENEKSDLLVQVEFEKQGRKVMGLYFTAEYKDKNKQKKASHEIPTLEELAPEIEPNPAFLAAKIPLSIETQFKHLSKYSPEEIEAILKVANDYIESLTQQGKTANIGGIYNKAFAENWGQAYLEDFRREKQKQEEIQAELEAQKKQEQEEEKRKQEEQTENKKIIEIFEKLPKDEQEKILDKIEEQTQMFFKEKFKTERKAGNPPYNRMPFLITLKKIILEELPPSDRDKFKPQE